MYWGKHKENGIWIAKVSQYRLWLMKGDRALYMGLGRLRVRIMKPHRPKSCSLCD